MKRILYWIVVALVIAVFVGVPPQVQSMFSGYGFAIPQAPDLPVQLYIGAFFVVVLVARRARSGPARPTNPVPTTPAPIPAPCTTGWIDLVPFGASAFTTLSQGGRFHGFRGHCNCGWRGPSREHFEHARTDVYNHNGLDVTGHSGQWDTVW